MKEPYSIILSKVGVDLLNQIHAKSVIGRMANYTVTLIASSGQITQMKTDVRNLMDGMKMENIQVRRTTSNMIRNTHSGTTKKITSWNNIRRFILHIQLSSI